MHLRKGLSLLSDGLHSVRTCFYCQMCRACSALSDKIQGSLHGQMILSLAISVHADQNSKTSSAKSCRTDTSLSCLQKRMFWKFLEGEKLPSPQLGKNFTLLLDKKEANTIVTKSHPGWFVVRSAGQGKCACGVRALGLFQRWTLDVSPLCC